MATIPRMPENKKINKGHTEEYAAQIREEQQTENLKNFNQKFPQVKPTQTKSDADLVADKALGSTKDTMEAARAKYDDEPVPDSYYTDYFNMEQLERYKKLLKLSKKKLATKYFDIRADEKLNYAGKFEALNNLLTMLEKEDVQDLIAHHKAEEMREPLKVLVAAKEASAKAHTALAEAQESEKYASTKFSEAEEYVKAEEEKMAKQLKDGKLAKGRMEKDIAVMKQTLAPYKEAWQKAKAALAEKQAEAATADKNVRIAQNPFIRARIAKLEKEQREKGVCQRTSATTARDCRRDKNCEWIAHRFGADRNAAPNGPFADLSWRNNPNNNRMFPQFLHHALEADQCVDRRGAEISALTEMIMPEPVIDAPTPPTPPPVVPTPAPAVVSVKPSDDPTPDEPEAESSSMQNGVALVFAVIVLFGMF